MRTIKKEKRPTTAKEFDAFKRAILLIAENADSLEALRASLAYILSEEESEPPKG